jgi:Uma2 family endonuclease
MLKAKPQLMTADEFLVWNLSQEDKYELVDGVPVPLHEPMVGQAGATEKHDVIVVNLIATLRNKLRGGPCRPTTSDQAVRTMAHKVRRPDVTIECAPRQSTALEVREPVVVFEVLSPSNRPSQIVRKLEEYRHHPAIRYIVLIEQATVSVTQLSRDVLGAWGETTLTDMTDTLHLDPPGVVLPLVEIYEDVVLSDDPLLPS